jgi:hypothetical protein
MTFYIRLAFTSGLALRIKGAAYFTKSQLSETDNSSYSPSGQRWTMRSRSVCVNGSADGEAHSGGGPSVLRGVHRDGIVVVERVKNSQYSSVNAEWSMMLAGGESRCSRSGLLEMLSRSEEAHEV